MTTYVQGTVQGDYYIEDKDLPKALYILAKTKVDKLQSRLDIGRIYIKKAKSSNSNRLHTYVYRYNKLVSEQNKYKRIMEHYAKQL